MSVFSLCLILLLILAAVVLLFPVVFKMDFCLNRSGFFVDLFIFKKKLWNYRKEWKKKEDEPAEESASEESVATIAKVSPTKVEEIKPIEAKPEDTKEKLAAEPEQPQSESLEKSEAPSPEPEQQQEKIAEANAEQKTEPESNVEPESDLESEQEKRKSLTDREFWTLLLSPEVDARAYRYFKKILNSFVDLFSVRFCECFVEGIRMDYESMGYGAAVNAMMKGYPFLRAWDLRMDWTRDHELQSAGHIRVSVNLCRILWFLTVTLVCVGFFAFVFWRRRAAVLKTGNLPELGYVRTKILNWIVEE